MLATAVNTNNDPFPVTQVEPSDLIVTILLLPVYIPFARFDGRVRINDFDSQHGTWAGGEKHHGVSPIIKKW
jgi:hypothetical protein